MVASVAEQGSLSLIWSETPEDTFSHDEAQIIYTREMSRLKQCMYDRHSGLS